MLSALRVRLFSVVQVQPQVQTGQVVGLLPPVHRLLKGRAGQDLHDDLQEVLVRRPFVGGQWLLDEQDYLSVVLTVLTFFFFCFVRTDPCLVYTCGTRVESYAPLRPPFPSVSDRLPNPGLGSESSDS